MLQRAASSGAGSSVGPVSRVSRLRGPVDGGVAQVYVPSPLERGEYRLDTTMSCVGWRETTDCR